MNVGLTLLRFFAMVHLGSREAHNHGDCRAGNDDDDDDDDGDGDGVSSWAPQVEILSRFGVSRSPSPNLEFFQVGRPKWKY